MKNHYPKLSAFKLKKKLQNYKVLTDEEIIKIQESLEYHRIQNEDFIKKLEMSPTSKLAYMKSIQDGRAKKFQIGEGLVSYEVDFIEMLVSFHKIFNQLNKKLCNENLKII